MPAFDEFAFTCKIGNSCMLEKNNAILLFSRDLKVTRMLYITRASEKYVMQHVHLVYIQSTLNQHYTKKAYITCCILTGTGLALYNKRPFTLQKQLKCILL